MSNQSTEPWTHEELISHAHDAQAILAFMTDSVDEDLLDACPNLQLIALSKDMITFALTFVPKEALL